MYKSAFSCILILLSAISFAEVPTKNFKIQMELQSSEVLQGEPLILKYAIKNVSGIRFEWNMEHDPRDYMKVKVKTKSGKNVNLMWDFRSLPSQTTHTGMSSNTDLDSGVNREGKIVLGQWVQFNRPGTYEVEVELAAPVRSSFYDGKERFFKTFEVVVKPISRPKIFKLGEKLLKDSQTLKWDEQIIALQSLFSLPESMASELWRTLIQKPLDCNGDNEVREQLTRIGTSLSRGILQEHAMRRHDEQHNVSIPNADTPPSGI